MQPCGPPGGLPKTKPLQMRESDRGNTPDIRSDTLAPLNCRKRKPYLPSINYNPAHEPPSSRCRRCTPQFASAHGLHLNLRRRWSKRRNGRAWGHKSTTRKLSPPHHPYLNKLISKSIPNHRVDRLIMSGSEDSLFGIDIAAVNVKMTNNLKS